MTWAIVLIIFFGCLGVLLLTGMPVGFAFLAVAMGGALFYWGGFGGFPQVVKGAYSSLAWFAILPIPLFVLMGNIIFETGVGRLVVDAFDKMLGRLPGRLSIVAILGGAALGTMIGVSGASIAVMGKNLLPEMEKRGYQGPMSYGPVTATGTLANLIPPSALAIILGAIAQVSIGALLIAIIVPGIVLTLLFSTYIVIRCKLQPSLAPAYTMDQISVMERVRAVVFHILPTGIVILAVIGSIFLGITTPSEAAALGVIACLLLAAIYKKLTIKAMLRAAISTVQISVMVLFIMAMAITFGKVLGSSGAISGLTHYTTIINAHPMIIIILTQVVLLVLGCFMDTGSIIMITMPIFMPIVNALGYDPVWYATASLITVQLGLITPPFGLDVFTLKAVVPKLKVGEIFRATMPFLGIGIVMMILVLAFPPIATWLPSLMSK